MFCHQAQIRTENITVKVWYVNRYTTWHNEQHEWFEHSPPIWKTGTPPSTLMLHSSGSYENRTHSNRSTICDVSRYTNEPSVTRTRFPAWPDGQGTRIPTVKKWCPQPLDERAKLYNILTAYSRPRYESGHPLPPAGGRSIQPIGMLLYFFKELLEKRPHCISWGTLISLLLHLMFLSSHIKLSRMKNFFISSICMVIPQPFSFIADHFAYKMNSYYDH